MRDKIISVDIPAAANSSQQDRIDQRPTGAFYKLALIRELIGVESGLGLRSQTLHTVHWGSISHHTSLQLDDLHLLPRSKNSRNTRQRYLRVCSPHIALLPAA